MLQAHDLPQVILPEQYLSLDITGARFNIEKAAYLGFAKAQTKMGAAYELCQLGCDFNPALSLHYNALAAKQGEPEADMAISKWFCAATKGSLTRTKNSHSRTRSVQHKADWRQQNLRLGTSSRLASMSLSILKSQERGMRRRRSMVTRTLQGE